VRFSLLLLACVLSPQDWAADMPPSFPDDATLHKQHVSRPHFPSGAAASKAAMQSHDRLSRFDPGRVVDPSFPKMPTQPDAHLDFSEIVENAKKGKQSETARRSDSPDLLVFVSFSMPIESLKRLARQVEQAGAAIVLRGLVADAKGKPSFHATGVAVGGLGLERDQGFDVNPMVFKRFGIRQVPAFVLRLAPDCQTCGDDFIPKHLKISGDVSLDYALRQMQSRRPEYAARIQPYLERLKSGFFRGARHDQPAVSPAGGSKRY